MSDKEKIFELKTELNELLSRKPNLREQYERVQQRMKNAGNSHNRCVVSQMMMFDSCMLLKDYLEKLGVLLAQLEKERKNLEKVINEH